jgi:hypothetical protein
VVHAPGVGLGTTASAGAVVPIREDVGADGRGDGDEALVHPVATSHSVASGINRARGAIGVRRLNFERRGSCI